MIKPVRDRVLVKPAIAEKKTASGLFIPETVSKNGPEKGTVVSSGSGRLTENGNVITLVVQEGDTVLYQQGTGIKTKVDGEDMVVLTEDQILAIID
jgi:chaperonin GroES